MYTVNLYGKTYSDIEIQRSSYCDNNNLAIQLISKNEGPFGVLTVNLGTKLPDNMAYVDVNNAPYAEEFIEKYNLGKPTGGFYPSEFVVYPLYEFDLNMF